MSDIGEWPRITRAQNEIEEAHGALEKSVTHWLPEAMTISLVTLNGAKAGQMILAHPDYDKKIVVERLRLAADILEGGD